MTDESTCFRIVFQLNTLLWALEELPTETEMGGVQPVLRQAGYYLAHRLDGPDIWLKCPTPYQRELIRRTWLHSARCDGEYWGSCARGVAFSSL